MAIDRTTLFQGPGHMLLGLLAILAADDISVRLAETTEDVAANGYGVIDRRRTDRRVEITCTPLEWDNLASLFPHATRQIGESIYGSADTTLTIVPRNGANSGIAITNVAVTKMPSVRYSANGKPLGQITLTGILANNADPALIASYYATAAVGALPAPDLAKIRSGIYTASWGALTGMGSMQGIQIDTDLALDWRMVDGHGAIDATLAGLVATASFEPVGVSAAAIIAAMGGAIGASPTKNDLLIKDNSGTTVFTVHNCQLISAPLQYGNDKSRVGALEFRSVRSASGGGLGPLWTIGV